jgi:hypothetical protein
MRGTVLGWAGFRMGQSRERIGSFIMPKRIAEAAVTLGLVAALALTAATSSIAQTRQNAQRNAPAAQDRGNSSIDETFGQAAPRTQPGNPAAAEQSGQCWIGSEDNDRGNFGYWGPCSSPKARPVR